MPNELKETSAQQYKQVDKPELAQVPALDASLNVLAKAGGFDFLEAVVDGSDSLNPVRKAKRNIFLTDASKKDQRAQLKKTCCLKTIQLLKWPIRRLKKPIPPTSS